MLNVKRFLSLSGHYGFKVACFCDNDLIVFAGWAAARLSLVNGAALKALLEVICCSSAD